MRFQTPQSVNRKSAGHIEVCYGINVKKWFNIIGSNNPKHITKFLVWKKYGFCPPRTTIKERQKFLKGVSDPFSYYAGVGERSNESRV